MTLCLQCRSDVPFPCIWQGPAPANAVMVASDWELRKRTYFRRLAVATASLEMSRRRIPDWLTDTIYGHRGLILWPSGRRYELHDTAIDDAFGNDGSYRWLSDFVRFAEQPPRQKPQTRVLERLRLLSLAFQIERPAVARHFCR